MEKDKEKISSSTVMWAYLSTLMAMHRTSELMLRRELEKCRLDNKSGKEASRSIRVVKNK